LCIL
jgi:hypothetical protein